MAKDYQETRECEVERVSDHDEPHQCYDREKCMQIAGGGASAKAPDSLICPETGQVTVHDIGDLRAQLEQFRLARAPSSAPMTSEVQRPKSLVNSTLVAVDDELHGRDGEWLVVVDASPDGRVLSLQCCESGTLFTTAAIAVEDDVRNHRLKVHRYGMPEVPPELEEVPEYSASDIEMGW